MLPKEQIQNIKKQLIEQINSTFPEDKKSEAISQIRSMNDEQLEEFLIQNNLIKNEEDGKQKCIFCSIIFGDVPSHKIAENEKAIAVLEINPISEGHTIVIPKEHLPSRKEFPDEIFLLANKIKEIINKKLKPKDVEVSTQNIMGHEIVNIIPIYGDENINSPRQKTNEKDLKNIQKKLSEKTEKIQEKKQEEGFKIKQFDAKDLWLPPRIP